MQIVDLETTIVSVPYRHQEVSSRVHRGGVTDVIVKLTCDNGLVGWGESCSGADVASVEQAVLSARPFVIDRDPWHSEAIARDFFSLGLWDYRAMTGNFAFAGIDMALWDLCGKHCGQPLYHLLGGPLHDEVDYFCYLAQGDPADLQEQCRVAVDRGYSCFYLKVGIDADAESEMLAAIRSTIGPNRKIRIDANEAWSVPEATQLIQRWDDVFGIDFVEAPVPIDPVQNMLELRGRVSVALCVNEGLSRTADAMRIIRSRCADVLCFSSYWVGTLRRFHTLCHAAHLEGQSVCKHTHGELGIAAAAGHHVMLSVPNATDGIQQTSTMMEHELLVEPTPISEGPTWGWISEPGLGVEIDENRLAQYHEAYRRDGQFLPYQINADQ